MSKKENQPQNMETRTAEAWAQFEQFLKKRGDRITRPRRTVFLNVFGRHDHFCADDLASELAGTENHVSRGTVYRTLDLMVEAGLVSKIRDSDVHAHFEHTFGHPEHEHLICDRCGRFIEATCPAVAHEVQRLCEEHNFTPRGHRLVVFGTCSNCI